MRTHVYTRIENMGLHVSNWVRICRHLLEKIHWMMCVHHVGIFCLLRILLQIDRRELKLGVCNKYQLHDPCFFFMWDTSCSKRRCFVHRRNVFILFPDLSNHSYAQEIDNHLQYIDTYYIHSPNYVISGTNKYLSLQDTRRDICICWRTFGCMTLSVLRHCMVGRYVPGALCGKSIVYYTGKTSVGEKDGFLYFDFCC